jgi:hypothetical protein
MVAEFDLMSVCWLVLLKIEPIYDSGVQHTPIKYRGRLSWRPHLFPKAIAGLSSRHFSKLLDAASPRLLVAWSSVCQNTPEKCGQAWPGMGKRLMPRNPLLSHLEASRAVLGFAAAARGALRQWRAESRVGSSIPAGKHQV